MSNVVVRTHGSTRVIEIDRPEVRNAVDGPTAEELANAFRDFESSDSLVAVLTGAGGTFCSGADLKAIADEPERANRVDPTGDGPMGPTRLRLSRPVIAAIEGHAVAGGLELALWCDLRVASEEATLGFYDRRWGVPLIDGGTIRLPRLIGQSRALDLILTGRGVGAAEALDMGLVNRVCPPGRALTAALDLAGELSRFPQTVMRSDRASVLGQWGLDETAGLAREFELGVESIGSGEVASGASRFAEGRGRHGSFEDV
jgi:enoyl-CoA hydratase